MSPDAAVASILIVAAVVVALAITCIMYLMEEGDSGGGWVIVSWAFAAALSALSVIAAVSLHSVAVGQARYELKDGYYQRVDLTAGKK